MFKTITKLQTYLPFLESIESRVMSERNHLLRENRSSFSSSVLANEMCPGEGMYKI